MNTNASGRILQSGVPAERLEDTQTTYVVHLVIPVLLLYFLWFI